jgi:hypothetical protein
VKTPQVLMRDRLMSNYTVKPALARLKRTLLGLGGAQQQLRQQACNYASQHQCTERGAAARQI